MSAPRITPIDAPYETSIADSFARVTPPGGEPLKLFRTLARNPRVMERMFAGSLLDKGSIELRDREILILRTCARCNAEYEWGVHVAVFSKRAGLSQEEITATLDLHPASDAWSPCELSLIRLADELHDQSSVSDTTWNSLAEHYTAEQALEMLALVGYYHTISFVTNALRIDLESFAPRFKQKQE